MRIIFCIIFIAIIHIFGALSIQAEDGKLLLKGCIKQNGQLICPGLIEAKFSAEQLLFYRDTNTNNIKVAKQLYNKAVSYDKQGNLDTARLYYLKSIQTFPYLAEAYNNLGNVDLCLGNYESAIINFKKVLNISSDYFPIIYCNLGLAYEKKGDYQKAINYYNLSIDVDSSNILAHNNLASIYLQLNQPQQAHAHIQKIKELAPNFYNNKNIRVVENR